MNRDMDTPYESDPLVYAYKYILFIKLDDWTKGF